MKSRLDYDIYRLNYGYTFYQSDPFELSANVGLHVIPVILEFEGTIAACVNGTCGSTEQRVVGQSITAPLPNGGFSARWEFQPSWFLEGQAQFFYLEFDDFTGAMMDLRTEVSYALNDHWHAGVGYGLYRIMVREQMESRDLKVDVRYQGGIAMLQYRF